LSSSSAASTLFTSLVIPCRNCLTCATLLEPNGIIKRKNETIFVMVAASARIVQQKAMDAKTFNLWGHYFKRCPEVSDAAKGMYNSPTR